MTANQKEATMTAFRTDVPHGCLTVGDSTHIGTIEQVSLTAYLIAGRWYGYDKVHGPYRRATALAIPQEWVDAVAPEMSARMRAQSDAAIASMLKRGV